MDPHLKACEIEKLLAVISKKWMLLIFKNIYEGGTSYSVIEKNIPNITPSTLSLRLKELQEIDFIEKRIVSQTPLKIQYIPTAKGESFSKHVNEMCQWAQKWM